MSRDIFHAIFATMALLAVCSQGSSQTMFVGESRPIVNAQKPTSSPIEQTMPVDPNWRQVMTSEAKRLSVKNIEQFENGIYGHYKQSRVFFSTVEQIPDDDKLYWVMVKVLSEKYSCFMVKRRKVGNLYRFYCKDKRSVVMRRGQVNNIIHFYGRTYDRNGRLIPLPKP